MKQFLLGIDIGSSSIKAAIVSAETGLCAGSGQSPETEMEIIAPKTGWAEQDPELWWRHVKIAIRKAIRNADIKGSEIMAVGISYQMHGLVCIDKNHHVLRNAIIWCDSRAVETGNNAFREIGRDKCLLHLLNSPGNFTASKLSWVKEHQPELFSQVWKFMLPGDYIAVKLTNSICTTASGLSEGIMWDFRGKTIAHFLLDHYGLGESLLPPLTPTFAVQGELSATAALETGLNAGTPVCYRAGDQPNNAFSLGVLEPGEFAATAGTSGVIYGVTDQVRTDPLSRVNTFIHVNNTDDITRNGILLCVNGTGILNSWIRKNAGSDTGYSAMNELAARVNPGSDGLIILPFGNGAERILENKDPGCSILGLNFNIHGKQHLFRAAQEGIAFAFYYGMKIMLEMGVDCKIIRAGRANMFLSPVFCETLANVSGATIELYNTDGARGAARGAGVGAGIFRDFSEAFNGLEKAGTITPAVNSEVVTAAYQEWLAALNKTI